jgi:hypothetical protein
MEGLVVRAARVERLHVVLLHILAHPVHGSLRAEPTFLDEVRDSATFPLLLGSAELVVGSGALVSAKD